MRRVAFVGSSVSCNTAAICLVAPSMAQVSQTQPAASPSTYLPILLSAEQAQADIALMRRGLETIHPGLYRYRTKAEIDAAFSRLDTVAQNSTTDLKLWRAIALMLAEIHCDHTKPEVSAAIDRYRVTHATHLPLRFKIIEGRMIVVASDGQPGAPKPAAEIVGINGIPVPLVLTTLGSAVEPSCPLTGDNLSHPRRIFAQVGIMLQRTSRKQR